MEKLNFSIEINAPKEKVWEIMLADETYRQWTEPFSPGSYFEGSWEEGSKMKFLSPGGDGMFAVIAENRPFEYLSIEHRGMIKNGTEDSESEEVKKWLPAHENYTFREKDGVTEVLVEMDTNEEYKKMFEETWPRALQVLKELSER